MTDSYLDLGTVREMMRVAARKFNLQSLLPDRVHLDPRVRPYFMVVDAVTTRPYWQLLSQLATQNGDSEIYLLPLNPSAEQMMEFAGITTAVSLSPAASFQEYERALYDEPLDGKAVSFVHAAASWIVIGSSLRWSSWVQYCDDYAAVESENPDAISTYAAELGLELETASGLRPPFILGAFHEPAFREWKSRLVHSYPTL
jgi:hypothetical protein